MTDKYKILHCVINGLKVLDVIEKTPLTSFISDPNIQYPVICVCGIGLSVLFSWLAIKSIDSAKAFVFRKTVKQ